MGPLRLDVHNITSVMSEHIVCGSSQSDARSTPPTTTTNPPTAKLDPSLSPGWNVPPASSGWLWRVNCRESVCVFHGAEFWLNDGNLESSWCRRHVSHTSRVFTVKSINLVIVAPSVRLRRAMMMMMMTATSMSVHLQPAAERPLFTLQPRPGGVWVKPSSLSLTT